MDEAVGEPIWSLPPDTLKLTQMLSSLPRYVQAYPDTLKLTQALPSPGWGGRCQAEFTQVRSRNFIKMNLVVQL